MDGGRTGVPLGSLHKFGTPQESTGPAPHFKNHNFWMERRTSGGMTSAGCFVYHSILGALAAGELLNGGTTQVLAAGLLRPFAYSTGPTIQAAGRVDYMAVMRNAINHICRDLPPGQ